MSETRANRGRTSLLLIGGAVALAAVAFLFLRRTGDRPPAGPTPSGSPDPVPLEWKVPPAPLEAAPVERPAGVGFLPGDVIIWSFQQDRKMTMEVAPPAPGGPVETVEMTLENHRTGSFRLIVLASPEGRHVGRLEIVDGTDVVRSDELGAAPRETDLATLLTGGASVVLGRDGRIEKLVFDASLGALQRRTWKSILGEWQVRWPDDPEAREWSAREFDETGPYMADYAVLSGPGESPRRVRKTRGNYEEIRSGGEAFPGARGESGGETEFLLDPLLLRADGHAEAKLVIPGSDVHATHRFTYLRTGHRHEDPGEVGATVAKILEAEGTTLAEAEPDDALDQGTPEEVFEEALQTLDVCHGDGRELSPEAMEAAERLTEALRRDPALVERLLSEIGAREDRSSLATRLVALLAAAETEAAQSGLATLILDRNHVPDVRRAAIHGTVALEAPTRALEAALVRDIELGADLGPDSLFVLGAVGFKVREGEPERAAAIERRILERLEWAPTAEERIDALDAVANLGPPKIPDGVRRAFETEDEEVRSAGYRALTRVPGAEARQLIVDALGKDPDLSVRVEAIQVLVRRELALGTPDPDLPALLRKVENEDPEEEVKESARSALRQIGR